MATPPDQVSQVSQTEQVQQEQVQPGEMTPVGQPIVPKPGLLEQKIIHMNAKHNNPLSYPIHGDLADDATS